MLLKIADWLRIREHFTDEEKKILNDAITGQVVCPHGCTIDEEKAGIVAEKVKTLLHERGF
jgi:hypothetical protein